MEVGNLKWVSGVGAFVWVVLLFYHASLMMEVLPKSTFIHAIPIGMVLSFRCGRVRSEDLRVSWVDLPGSLTLVVAILTAFVYTHDVSTEFLAQDKTIGTYLYKRFAFWGFLSMNATAVSQVLIPMFMMVRPWHCLFLMMTLTFRVLV